MDFIGREGFHEKCLFLDGLILELDHSFAGRHMIRIRLSIKQESLVKQTLNIILLVQQNHNQSHLIVKFFYILNRLTLVLTNMCCTRNVINSSTKAATQITRHPSQM